MNDRDMSPQRSSFPMDGFRDGFLNTLSIAACNCGPPQGQVARGDGRLAPSWNVKRASFAKPTTWELDALPPRAVTNARSIAGRILADAKRGNAARIAATLDAEALDLEQASVILGALDLANGNTALMLAARGGHLQCCELLLQRGANCGAKNRYGKTAATLASNEGHMKVANLLEGVAALESQGLLACV